MGSSWAALAAEEDPQGRGVGTLLVEAGAGGGGGRGGGERGGGGRGGRGGGGVGQREKWEDPMATQSDKLRGRRSLRGSGTSRPIKALARPPCTPWEEAPARSPNPRKCGDEESYGKV